MKFIEPTGKLILNKKNVALFIKLGDLEKILNDDRFRSSKKNMILINIKHINDDDLSEVLTHEIYHYVDVLLDNISDKLELSKFVDKNIINDKNYLNYKAALLLDADTKNLNNYISDLIADIAINTVDNIEYLSDDGEIFVRWKSFKSKMVKLGYLKSLSDKIDQREITKYLQNNKVSLTDLDILLVLDWNKMEELDSLTN